ncbi:hypothetical protein DM49_3901 [Burkholderia mallei]|nr:hypothetical protein BURPS668_A1927 [Burkholderia pseudomallei 668]EEC31606.1 conserved hypothetical protein [Burkholderia pseudomallei 576]EEH24921.1 conserved hypothetical protein [Burkholderia pseudomallei Pakistan 9]KGS19336.1 hypothetical protein X962_5920 [Burkholderia pseudomallei MSHR7343]KOS76082.1 hypothetical protein DM46_2396 [Burkholderia mallei]
MLRGRFGAIFISETGFRITIKKGAIFYKNENQGLGLI